MKDYLKIQVVRTGPHSGGAAQSVLTRFYGTVVMNFLTWNKAYCVFPRTTFVRRGMWLTNPTELFWQEWMAVVKYEQRGWEELDSVEEAEKREGRRVGDSMTWVIPFPTEGMENAIGDGEVEDIRFGVQDHSVVLLKRKRQHFWP